MKYSQEDFNKILLSKSLNEFYFAIIEHRGEFLTDEEYEKITKRSDTTYSGVPKEDIDDLTDVFKSDKEAKEFLAKCLYTLARIRHLGVLTIIDDEVYDIVNGEFVDLKRNKIVQYDNFANYYNETNARLKVFSPEDVPQLKQKTVLIDVDDESIFQAYEEEHINQESSEDLTEYFLSIVRKKPYTLFRNLNNN